MHFLDQYVLHILSIIQYIYYVTLYNFFFSSTF